MFSKLKSLFVTEQISLPVLLSVSTIQLVGKDGFCVIATDLSAQKQNALLVQHQEWLSALLSILPVPLVLLDANLKGFTFINAKATEVLEGVIDGSTARVFQISLKTRRLVCQTAYSEGHDQVHIVVSPRFAVARQPRVERHGGERRRNYSTLYI